MNLIQVAIIIHILASTIPIFVLRGYYEVARTAQKAINHVLSSVEIYEIEIEWGAGKTITGGSHPAARWINAQQLKRQGLQVEPGQ